MKTRWTTPANCWIPVNMSQSPEGTATAGERKYKGVRRRRWGKWVSEIRVPGSRERLWLGSYTAPEAAAVAHDTAVFFLRGPDWAHCLNFPDHVAKYSWAGLSPRSIQRVASDSGMAVDAQLVVPGPQAQALPPPPPPPAQRADVGAVEDANRREAGEYGLYDGSDFWADLCFEGMDINDIFMQNPCQQVRLETRESWTCTL